MLLSRTELVGWAIAVVGVVVMGFLSFHGAFHDINKVQKSSFPAMQVRIVTDPNTVGKYVPATVRVHIGQPITFTNVSNVDHTATDQNEAFDSRNIGINQSWTYRPEKTGTFHYICSYHPLMHGVVIVTK